MYLGFKQTALYVRPLASLPSLDQCCQYPGLCVMSRQNVRHRDSYLRESDPTSDGCEK
jgi:hypothetical protein